MRARNIKPGFFENEILGTIDPITQLLFSGLWLIADKEGRLENRPLRIKAKIFPYRDVNINKHLDELAHHKFITFYSIGEEGFISINNFLLQK